MADTKLFLSHGPTGKIPLKVFDNGDNTYSLTPKFISQRITSATTTVVSTGPVRIKQIRVLGGTLGAVTVYRGSTLDPVHCIVTPAAQGLVVAEDTYFEDGLTITTAAATEIDVTFYEEA
jgi:hypothetical protein